MNIVTRLPISVDDPLLPVVPAAYIRPYGEPALEDATAHWLFKGATPLEDKLNARALTASDAGDIEISNGVLTLTNAVDNTKWVKTDILEVNPRTWTHIVAVDLSTFTASGIICSILNNLSAAGAGSALVVDVTAAKIRFYWKQTPDTSSFSFYVEDDIPDNPNDKFVFIAVSESDVSVDLHIGVGGNLVTTSGARSDTRPLATSGRPMTLGNAYYNTAEWIWNGQIRLMEWIEYHRRLTTAEVAEVYARSRTQRAPWVGQELL